jgi:hypothetical protein
VILPQPHISTLHLCRVQRHVSIGPPILIVHAGKRGNITPARIIPMSSEDAVIHGGQDVGSLQRSIEQLELERTLHLAGGDQQTKANSITSVHSPALPSEEELEHSQSGSGSMPLSSDHNDSNLAEDEIPPSPSSVLSATSDWEYDDLAGISTESLDTTQLPTQASHSRGGQHILKDSKPCCSRPDLGELDGCITCFGCGYLLPPANYEYQELTSSNEIRLARLMSGRFEEPIVCELFHCGIGEKPFQAISYTWADESGESEPLEQITIKLPNSATSYIQATPNSVAALRRVRHPSYANLVWVDALCVNRQNLAERGEQVKLMPKIYSTARQVSVYLGESSENSDQLFDLINTTIPLHSAPFSPDSVPSEGSTVFHIGKAIDAMLHRRWFHRVWVIQEVAVAKDVIVICGSRKAPWERLISASFDSPNKNSFGYSGYCPSILSLPLHINQPVENMYQMLAQTRSVQATDARDKVFALFGLLEDYTQTGLEPDYSLSWEEVYTQTTEYLILKSGSLDLLAAAQAPSTCSQLPSWVIPWNQTSTVMPLSGAPCFGKHCKEGRGSYGALHDWISETYSSGERPTASRHQIRPSCNCHKPQSSSDIVFSDVPLAEEMSETRRVLTVVGQRFDVLGTFYKNDVASILSRSDPTEIKSFWQPELPVEAGRWAHDASRRWLRGRENVHDDPLFAGRRICFGRGGICGIVPSQAEIGDFVCKFAAASQLHLLRQVSDHYIYIGEFLKIDQQPAETLFSREETLLPLIPLRVETFDIW